MIKVLIVDDEPLARENLRVFLQEQSDIEIVGECSNAVEGIGAVHKLRPDVLFLDIQMPDMDGYETIKIMRERGYVLPVVALTAHAMQSDKQRCLDAGMNAHIAKPVDFDKLKEILQNL